MAIRKLSQKQREEREKHLTKIKKKMDDLTEEIANANIEIMDINARIGAAMEDVNSAIDDFNSFRENVVDAMPEEGSDAIQEWRAAWEIELEQIEVDEIEELEDPDEIEGDQYPEEPTA